MSVIQDMNRQAASLCSEVFGMPSDQVYSQPDESVSTTGAGAYPFLPTTVLSSGDSMVPTIDVASYHIAAWPWL